MESKPLHYNVPQMRSMIISPHEYYGIMARGTGKSEGVQAPRSIKLVNTLPRSTLTFVQRSFAKMLSQFLPAIVRGWEKQGYKQGVHFLIGEKPTEKWRKTWNWSSPLQPVFTYDHVIVWYNGTVIKLISQDRIGSANGLSVDAVIGDEAKLLDVEKLNDELLPANRGIIPQFANNPLHHSLTFTSDMPRGTAGKWLLKKKEQNEPTRIKAVIDIEYRLFDLRQKYHSTKSERLRKSLSVTISKHEALVNQLRMGMVFYDEASALDNIHGLGIDKIKSYARTLKPFELRTSILNMLPRHPEDGFYPALDEDKHGYFSYDYHHTFGKHGYNFAALQAIDDCRGDGDIDPHRSLHIGMDYNKSIWPIVTGQVHGDELRVLSGKHVLAPKGYRDCIKQWANYYEPHKKKIVYFWHDQTAYSETRAPLADVITAELVAHGWTVVARYFGAAPKHEAKYNFIDDLLHGDYKGKELTINRDNCEQLLTSLFLTEATRRTKDGFGKDKSKEKDKEFPQEEAPHYSDAFDTLLWGIFMSGLSHSDNEEHLPPFMIH